MDNGNTAGTFLAHFSWSRFASLGAATATGDNGNGAALERWVDEEQFVASFPGRWEGHWTLAWWRGGRN